jgi:regulator of sirC expression with transglutaminase-like and TPR domain
MDLDATLARLARDPRAPCDVADLALHLARDEYPDVDADAYLSELVGMAREAQRYVRGGLESRVAGLSRYLFHEMGFHGNERDYYDPRNSYLNQVLDRRTGIPITLTAVAMAVGARVGLRVAGVGLPGHFIAKAEDRGQEVFFDPFHGGRLLTVEGCEQLVRQATGAPYHASREALEAVPPGLMAQRMLTNLKVVYLRTEDFRRAARVIGRLRQLAPDDAVQRRDLGISLLHAGQPGRALDHLTAYLAAVPQATDAQAVRRLADRARGEIAQWN